MQHDIFAAMGGDEVVEDASSVGGGLTAAVAA